MKEHGRRVALGLQHRTILETALRGGPTAGDFKAFLLAMPAGPQFRIPRSRDRGRPVKL